MRRLAGLFLAVGLWSSGGALVGACAPGDSTLRSKVAFGAVVGLLMGLVILCTPRPRYDGGSMPGDDGPGDPEPGPMSPDDFRRQVLRSAEDGSIDAVLESWRGRVPPSRKEAVRKALSAIKGLEEIKERLIREAPPLPGKDAPTPRFRVNKAVRWLDGQIFVIENGVPNEKGDVVVFGALTRNIYLRASELEVATPLRGEVWQWFACSKHLPETTGPQKCPPHDDVTRSPAREREAAECGCLQPVNFGKGPGTVQMIVGGQSFDLHRQCDGAEWKAKVAAAIEQELRLAPPTEQWTCKWTLGIHTDGPCQCEPGMTRFAATDGGK